ncbi:MAG: hypothetical protein WD004_07815 [Actinomycetota bacterium]
MEHADVLIRLEPEARADLLEVLTSPRNVRADRIREYWQRPEGRLIADTLIELEVDDDARAKVVETLRRLETARQGLTA